MLYREITIVVIKYLHGYLRAHLNLLYTIRHNVMLTFRQTSNVSYEVAYKNIDWLGYRL